MSTLLLKTKLYILPARPEMISRPRLIERLNAGLHCKLTLISTPAGPGKTTLLSEWVADNGQPIAWLSLDEGDNDPLRFLAYFRRPVDGSQKCWRIRPGGAPISPAALHRTAFNWLDQLNRRRPRSLCPRPGRLLRD
ncbi:MAG: hypothetical protein SXV54_02860 [Chloroflexota bacterium]|nr:hypothetical protein [Chloroflexota bacterium]